MRSPVAQDAGGDAAHPAPHTGVLPYQAINAMWREGEIVAPAEIGADQVQPASLDLRLGPVAYRVRASFLPGPDATVLDKIRQLDGYAIDLSNGAVLEKGCVYVVPLLETLEVVSGVSGFANPKSSTGRLDILTRLLTDRSSAFDQIARDYHGPLYIEIAPRTFSIVVRQGERLSQLRLFRGDHRPADARIQSPLQLSVDLAGADSKIIGYRARRHAPLIDLAKIQHYDPEEFWDPIRGNRARSLILDPEDFYILASREKVQIPPEYAAEMVPFDPTIGEFRIHYAGFFDPGFGYGAGDVGGTRAVLEVRSHEVPFVMEDGQIVASLIYERLTERPRLLYGEGIGSSYQRQGLKLSKHFRAA